MEKSSNKRISSGGFWHESLEVYFEQLPVIWGTVAKFYATKEHYNEVRENRINGTISTLEQELTHKIGSLHQSIVTRSKQADQNFEEFRYNYNHDYIFSEQAPIRTAFKSSFSTKDIKNFNPDGEIGTELFMESIKGAACFIFQKKQNTFIDGLLELKKLHEKLIRDFQNKQKNRKLLKFIQDLFCRIEIIGLDLNLLFFQPDIYLFTASTMLKSCKNISICNIQPSRYFLKYLPKIFLFEEDKTWYKYNETFKDLPKNEYAEFDEYLRNYTHQRNIKEKKSTALNYIDKLPLNDVEFDEEKLNFALEYIEDISMED
ncbi:hypothetical protein HCN44_006180 [Aphidius gifuensis]|uniref:Uncharacterized protein n=1 Tax=Aphidius gifuensis TaxID=684658 RepID=A0A835CVT9_APHGI|nr:hypothetical protein HCN44_006180 [Aphidius gifuensis]